MPLKFSSRFSKQAFMRMHSAPGGSAAASKPRPPQEVVMVGGFGFGGEGAAAGGDGAAAGASSPSAPRRPRAIYSFDESLTPLQCAAAAKALASSRGSRIHSVQPFCNKTCALEGEDEEALCCEVEACEPATRKHILPQGVASVERDRAVRIEGGQAMPWGIRRVLAPAARTSRRIRPVNVDVWVFDTGVARKHPDLNVVRAISVVPEEPTPEDLHGHGTAVCGVIAARDNGVDVVGVAPGARIHSVKVLDRNGNGYLSDVITGLEFMIRWKRQYHRKIRNAVVANLSLGAFVGSPAYTALDRAVARAVAAGITVVVAAGNEGDDARLYTPAHCREAISVGAVDMRNGLSSYSNRGPAVNLLAPGDSILTTYLDGKLAQISGTSFAAPHVTGAACLHVARARTQLPRQTHARLRNLAAAAGSVRALATPGTTNLVLNARLLNA